MLRVLKFSSLNLNWASGSGILNKQNKYFYNNEIRNILSLQGLRWTALVGVCGTCIGAWIKVFSVRPDLFYVGFIGQAVVALAQVILVSLCTQFFYDINSNH